MHDISIYHNSSEILKRKEEKIYLKFIIFFITIMFILIGICFIDYENEHIYTGFTVNGNVEVYLSSEALKMFDNNTIEINNNKISYTIKSLSKVDNDNKLYKLTISINDELKENELINFKITDGKTNLYRNFIKRIWKGFE